MIVVKLLVLFIILIFPMVPTFWAIFDIAKRRFSSDRRKIIWLFTVATFPLIGAILYILFERKKTEPLAEGGSD